MQNEIYSNELKTVCNAVIQIGDIDDTGKGRHFVSKFIQDGLVKIEGHGIVLLKKETIDQSLQSMVGAPVIIKHQDVTNENADELRCGVISKAYFNDFDGWYYCEGIIWDEKAKELVNKGWSVSCSYDFLAYNDEGGVENNIKYDKEFTQLNFTHLALVDNPRYERANIVFNSKVDNDKWITIHPNGEDSKGKPLLLKDGETPKEAIDRTYGKKDNISKDYKENTSHYGKKEHQEEIISLYEGLKNPNKSEARKKEDRELLEHHLKELSKYSDTSGIHLSDEETKRENKIKEIKKELNKKQSDTKDESKKSKIDFSEYSDAELEHAIDVYKSNLSTAMEYGDDQYNTEKDMLSEIEKELGRRKAKTDTKDQKKDKYIGKKFFIGDREDEITEYLPQFDRYMGKNPEGLNWGAQLYTKDELDKYYIKSDEEYLKEKELREKQKVERERAQKQKEEEEKAAQAEYMRDNGFTEGMTDLQKGKTLKDLNKEVWYKQVNDGKPTTSKKMIEELISKGFKPKEEIFRTSKKINGERIDKDTVSKILEDKDGSFYKLNSTEYKYAQYLQNKDKQSDTKDKQPDSKGDLNIKKTTVKMKSGKTKEIEYVDSVPEGYKKLEGAMTAPLGYTWYHNGKSIIDKERKTILVKDKVNNNKEQDMLLEELKKLIFKVENSKENDEMIDNEKVDKRKLIDEVAGIMKSAGCDDEDIRTAIGKMEKIGYDKSEDGSADNKKVKNEEEKKDDKVDNEDEEDKKEVKEVKEDVKEDVDNKCKNSKSSFDKINEIYNSVKQIEKETGYVSRQQKLDNAVEYFK